MQKLLAWFAWSLLMMCVGWWFHGHPDKLFQYTGFIGDYASSHWIEHQPACTTGYTLVEETGGYACRKG